MRTTSGSLSHIHEDGRTARGGVAPQNAIEKRIHPEMPHTVIGDELDWIENTMCRMDRGSRRRAQEAVALSG